MTPPGILFFHGWSILTTVSVGAVGPATTSPVAVIVLVVDDDNLDSSGCSPLTVDEDDDCLIGFPSSL